MNDPDVFSIFDGDLIPYSHNISLISFHSQDQKNSAEKYIFTESNKFFENILKITDPIQYIPYSKTINWQDFNSKHIEIKYFYTMLFHDLCERDSEGKLINKLKWSITFDEKMAPIKTAFASSKSPGKEVKLKDLDFSRPARRYGVITINGKAVFYYLHFTLQEILDVI